MTDDVQRLIDSERIRDLMSRYARAVDRFDLAALRDAHHSDAHDDHRDDPIYQLRAEAGLDPSE